MYINNPSKRSMLDIANGSRLQGLADAASDALALANDQDAAGGLVPVYGNPTNYTVATGITLPNMNNNTMLYLVLAALTIYLISQER